MHENKTKFERNNSLKYCHMTRTGKKKIRAIKEICSIHQKHITLNRVKLICLNLCIHLIQGSNMCQKTPPKNMTKFNLNE